MVVVFQIFADDVTKLLFVCQDQFVEAFSLNGLVEGFNVAIVLWLARRDAFRAAADGFEDTLKLLREKRIVVMDKIGHVLFLSIEPIGLVPRDLRHPLSVGIAFDSVTPDFACGDDHAEFLHGLIQVLLRARGQ